MKWKCDDCSQTLDAHLESHAETAATLFMMRQIAETLPKDYAETLNSILQDWRTHALPECNPLAIK
jgi:hypothetical protein